MSEASSRLPPQRSPEGQEIAEEAPSLWRDIRSAVAGARRDYTQEPLSRAILLLAIPMVLEMVMQSIFSVCDIWFVSQLDERAKEAVAVVGLSDSFLTLVFAVALGLSMGTVATVARRIGQKDRDGAASATVQALTVGFVASVVLSLLGILTAAPLFRIMLPDQPALAEYGAPYGAILLGGSPTVLFLFLLNAAFRGAGDAVIAMRALWLANGLNILLDPVLIFGWGPVPAMGVEGAAVATTIGRGIGVLYQLSVLFGGRHHLALQLRHLRVDVGSMLRLLRISLGGMFQYFVATSSFIVMISLVASFGDAALAGYTVAIRIIIFVLLPAWGIANAAATLVGQNLGAQRVDRAERSVWAIGFINTGFMVAVAALFLSSPSWLVGLLNQEPDVVLAGAACLTVVSFGYPLYGFGMVLMQSFNGAGDTYTPTLINIFCLWGLQIPLGYFLASTGLGLSGVFYAILIAQSSLALVATLLFRRGRWKARAV